MSIKLQLIKFIPLCLITLLYNQLAVNAQLSNTESVSSNSSKPNTQPKLPTPPPRGTPTGNKTPGATRNDQIWCKETSQPLTALVANNGKDFTLSDYPTFWFYIPYQSEDIKYLEFALKDGQNSTTIYRTAIKLEANSGIINVTIPDEKKYALEVGKNYSWNLLLSCQGNETYEADLVVNGWIQKLAITPELPDQLTQLSEQELKQFYLDKNLWSDAINKVAQQYYNNPNDEQIKADWFRVLEIINQSVLSQKDLVGSVLLSPDL